MESSAVPTTPVLEDFGLAGSTQDFVDNLTDIEQLLTPEAFDRWVANDKVSSVLDTAFVQGGGDDDDEQKKKNGATSAAEYVRAWTEEKTPNINIISDVMVRKATTSKPTKLQKLLTMSPTITRKKGKFYTALKKYESKSAEPSRPVSPIIGVIEGSNSPTPPSPPVVAVEEESRPKSPAASQPPGSPVIGRKRLTAYRNSKRKRSKQGQSVSDVVSRPSSLAAASPSVSQPEWLSEFTASQQGAVLGAYSVRREVMRKLLDDEAEVVELEKRLEQARNRVVQGKKRLELLSNCFKL